MTVGDAFVQGVERVIASTGENVIEVGTPQDILGTGVTTFDFTAGDHDKGKFVGSRSPP